MGPEVMRDESFRVSGPSKANLSPVRGGHYPVCGEPAWSSVSRKGRGKRTPLLRLSVFLFELGHLVSSAIGLRCIAHRPSDSHYETAGFPEPPACRRRVVGCHSFFNDVNQFCILPSYLCVYVSSIYESLYHLPVVSLSTQPSTYSSFSPLVFWEPLRHSLTNRGSLSFLFAIHGSYQFICFYLFLLSVSIFIQLHDSYSRTVSSGELFPLKLKLLSPSPRLSIACSAGRCAKTVFSLWVWFDFLLSTLPNLAHCEAVSSEYAVTEWNLRKHSFSRF